MIFVILGLVIGIFMAWNMVRPIFDFDGIIMGLLLSVLLGALGISAGFGIAAFIGMFPSKHLEEVTRHDLVALKDNVGIQGSFFLGTGSVNNKLSYFYYRKEGSAYKAEKADDSSLIFEDTENNPYVLEKDDAFNHSFWYAIAFPIHVQTEFHVPKGSVLKNYTLDLH